MRAKAGDQEALGLRFGANKDQCPIQFHVSLKGLLEKSTSLKMLRLLHVFDLREEEYKETPGHPNTKTQARNNHM